jgi:hypothetical protein
MIDTLFWILVGAFIGWNFPQPWWARIIQSRIVDFFQKKS